MPLKAPGRGMDALPTSSSRHQAPNFYSPGPKLLEPFSLKLWPGSGVGKAVWGFSQIQYPLEPKPISLAQGPVIEALALFSNPCGSIAVRGWPVNARTT